MKITQLNCGGASGAWRALNEFKKSDILAIQEHGMSNKELRQFEKSAGARGWISTSTPAYNIASRWTEDRTKGGVVTLVKRNLR